MGWIRNMNPEPGTNLRAVFCNGPECSNVAMDLVDYAQIVDDEGGSPYSISLDDEVDIELLECPVCARRSWRFRWSGE